MSSYNKSRDVRLEEIDSNVSPSSEAIVAIIQQLEASNTLSEDSKDVFKLFEKSLESRRLKKLFKLKLGGYSAGELTLQDIRQNNQEYRCKENARRKHAGITEVYKLNENKDVSAEGRISIYSCSKKKFIVAQFESQIKEDLFKSSIIEYSFKNEKIILLIQTFFNFLECAKDLGVPRKKLGQVFNIFCKTCIPSLQGTINTDASCLAANLDKILEHISIKQERKKIENHLNQILRNPGEPLINYTYVLFSLYNSFASLDYLVESKEEDSDMDGISDLIADPSQMSKFKEVNDKVQVLLLKSLRSLCSPDAQSNISDLIRKKKSGMTNEAIKECIYRCDERHPLQSVTKLPTSMIYISSNDHSVDFNPPLTVLEGHYGYFGRSTSPNFQRELSPKPPYQSSNMQRQQSPRRPYQASNQAQSSNRPYQVYNQAQSSNRPYQSPGRQSNQVPPQVQSSNSPYQAPNKPQSPRPSNDYQRPQSSGYQRPRSQSPNQRSTGYGASNPLNPSQPRGQSSPAFRRNSRQGSPSQRPGGQFQRQVSPGPGRQSPNQASPRSGFQKPPIISRQPSRSPTSGQRTPSPSKWKHPLSFFLDTQTVEKLKYLKDFCIKCGDSRHTFNDCKMYHGEVSNRCYLCRLFHSTYLCKNSLKENAKPLFKPPKN